jgi:hypothetical protein
LSLSLWTFLLGAMGALLAVPATLLVRALLIDADPSARWANLLLSSTPRPAGPEPPPPSRSDDEDVPAEGSDRGPLITLDDQRASDSSPPGG